MSKIKVLLLALCWHLAGGSLSAQTVDTNSFNFTIAPTNNTVFIADTTNLVTVTINNFLSIVMVDTNQVTNLVFTNISIRAVYTLGSNTTLPFLDGGRAPDKKASDGTFSANMITPPLLVGTTVTLNFTIIGDDLSFTNDAGQQEITRMTNTGQANFTIVTRPPNDKMTNAFKFPTIGGAIVATNNYASMEPGEPQHAQVPAVDASVWWNWSSPVSTNVLIDTAGSSFDTILGVYTGNAVNQLTEVASATNDFVLRLKAHVNFNAIAGTTYRIAVAGWGGPAGAGNIRLRIAPGGTPDTRPPLVSILNPTKQALITSSNILISGVAKEPVSNDSGLSNILVQVNQSPPTNATGLDSWSVYLNLPPGTNVIRAYAVDFAGNVGPFDAIVVRYMNPTNDNFSDAILLAGVGGTVTAINGRATLEPGEPLHAENAGGRSIWYAWRAPAHGTLSLSTSSSDFDTLLDLYAANNVFGTNTATASISNLVTVASNDDAAPPDIKQSMLTANVVSNQLYYISVDGFGGASGNVQLQYTFVAPVPGQFYYLTLTASTGGSVYPPSAMFPAGARVILTATPDKSFEFVTWEGATNVTQNPLTVTMNQDTSLNARFQLKTTIGGGTTNQVLTDGFESGDFTKLPWSTGPVLPWRVQTNFVSAGVYAVRSAPILDGQKSSLSLTTNMVAGLVSFDLKVSSEPSWDFLEFFVNGKFMQRWSGEAGWTNYTCLVAAGANRLEWRYSKDPSYTEGLDTAFIDNLYIPLAPTTIGAAPTLILVRMSDGQMQITLQGQPNRSYSLEASTDMSYWYPIDAKSSPSGICQFLDNTRYDFRFYRAKTQ